MPKAPEAIPQKRLTVGVWHCQHRLQSPRKPLEQVFSKIQTTECKISVSLVAPSWNAPAGTTVFEGRPPLWTAWRSHVANFLHGHVYCASPHYPMSIRAIDPVCPQAILPPRVTLFPSGTLRGIYSIQKL